jgi:hypothetical protein
MYSREGLPLNDGDKAFLKAPASLCLLGGDWQRKQKGSPF